jgi:hypothetical protein
MMQRLIDGGIDGILGSYHVFVPFAPLRRQRSLGRGCTNQAVLFLSSRAGAIFGPVRSHRDQRRPLCSVMRLWSSQPTRLSGDVDRKTWYDPIANKGVTITL